MGEHQIRGDGSASGGGVRPELDSDAVIEDAEVGPVGASTIADLHDQAVPACVKRQPEQVCVRLRGLCAVMTEELHTAEEDS